MCEREARSIFFECHKDVVVGARMTVVVFVVVVRAPSCVVIAVAEHTDDSVVVGVRRGRLSRTGHHHALGCDRRWWWLRRALGDFIRFSILGWQERRHRRGGTMGRMAFERRHGSPCDRGVARRQWNQHVAGPGGGGSSLRPDGSARTTTTTTENALLLLLLLLCDVSLLQARIAQSAAFLKHRRCHLSLHGEGSRRR